MKPWQEAFFYRGLLYMAMISPTQLCSAAQLRYSSSSSTTAVSYNYYSVRLKYSALDSNNINVMCKIQSQSYYIALNYAFYLH